MDEILLSVRSKVDLLKQVIDSLAKVIEEVYFTGTELFTITVPLGEFNPYNDTLFEISSILAHHLSKNYPVGVGQLISIRVTLIERRIPTPYEASISICGEWLSSSFS